MMRVCTACHAEKPIGAFGRESRRDNGISGRCKSCLSKKAIAWNKANRDRKNANNRRHTKKHKEYYAEYRRAWRLANPELMKAIEKERYPRKKHRIVASNKYRKALVLKACPSWADKSRIEQIYELARVKTETSGSQWHVDHIVPLRSKLVCGLHVEHNLQVIPAAINLSKQNFYWPDMPEAP